MNIKKILKDTLMITIITLVAGIALGFTYKLTKKPIEEQSLISKQKAYKAVFTEASEFIEDSAVNIEKSDEVLLENGITGATIDEVVKAIDDSGDADADRRKGFIKEHPADSHTDARSDDQGKFFLLIQDNPLQPLFIHWFFGICLLCKEPFFRPHISRA